MYHAPTCPLRDFLADESGPTAVEYAIVVSMIAALVIGAVILLTEATEESFQNSANAIDSAIGS